MSGPRVVHASDGPLPYTLCASGDAQRMVVVVHGRSGDPGSYLHAFQRVTGPRVALLVPWFGSTQHGGYQQLRNASGPMGAAQQFVAVLDEVAARFGIATDPVDLVGFSGGAQFVHRFALVEPRRVRRVVAVAAGWYTELDTTKPFPFGIGGPPGSVNVDVRAFLDVQIRLMVGENDIRRDQYLRTTHDLDTRQGPHRLARALRWLDHVNRVAAAWHVDSSVSFELLPGTGHLFWQAIVEGQLDRRVMDFLDLAERNAAMSGDTRETRGAVSPLPLGPRLTDGRRHPVERLIPLDGAG